MTRSRWNARNIRCLPRTAATAWLIVSCAAAQVGPPSGLLEGKVVNSLSGEPIRRAEITSSPVKTSTASSSTPAAPSPSPEW